MSRHASDDFSFLPTVDSTDEEGMESEELNAKQKARQPEWTEAVPEEAAEQVPAEEPVYEEVEAVAPEPPVFVQAPEPASMARVSEPDAAHPPAEEERIRPEWQKEPEIQSARDLPPQQPTDLSKVEDVALPILPAPQARPPSIPAAAASAWHSAPRSPCPPRPSNRRSAGN
jgi:hypothetical protein